MPESPGGRREALGVKKNGQVFSPDRSGAIKSKKREGGGNSRAVKKDREEGGHLSTS